MFRFVLLTALLTTSYSWTLKSTHTNIVPQLTDDVTLTCFHKGSDNVKSAIDQLTRIRLVKMDSTYAWTTYAEVIFPNTSTVLLVDPDVPGVVASGQLGRLDDTFLSVTWSTSSDSTVGRYKCEVDGFSVDRGNDFHVNTNMINITNNAVSTTDLLEIAIQLKKQSVAVAEELNDFKRISADQCSHLNSSIMETLFSHAAQMMNKTNTITNELKLFEDKTKFQNQELTSGLLSQVKSDIEDNYYELRYWPSGNYCFLSPVVGCPDTRHSKFLSGHVKVETQTNTKPHHNVSSASHLGQDLFERCGSRNVLKLPFCSMDTQDLRTPWPKGTYCIQYSVSQCPVGFDFGHATAYLESSIDLLQTNVDVFAPIVHSGSSRYIQWYFCCRQDGDVTMPILLPNARPFYLYRFKGKCQAVFKTRVVSESLKLDTDDSRTDAYATENHADGTLNDVTIELCYYTYHNA